MSSTFVLELKRKRLITAAPDLLKALQGLRNEVSGMLGIARPEIAQAIGETNTRCIEIFLEDANAAIRKAKGEL